MALGGRLSAPVAIVGGGPVGLFLALALVRASVAAQVFERRCEGRAASRSIGIHPPSLDLLGGLGLADRFVERGVVVALEARRTPVDA